MKNTAKLGMKGKVLACSKSTYNDMIPFKYVLPLVIFDWKCQTSQILSLSDAGVKDYLLLQIYTIIHCTGMNIRFS